MDFLWGYVVGCCVTFLTMFMGFNYNENKEARRLENKHDCKDYVITNWKWDTKRDDYEPDVDVCTKCGKVLYEY